MSEPVDNIEQLKAQLAEAITALNWYQNRGQYIELGGRNHAGRPCTRIYLDEGQIARDAIVEIEKLGKEK